MPLLNQNKYIFKIFVKIVSGLNKLKIKPIVYGSLGIYLILGEKGKINDLDFILPNSVFERNWKKIKEMLIEKMDCKIDPNHCQEFYCGKTFVSFLKISQINKLANINIKELKKEKYKDCVYFNLPLKKHLEIYQNGLKTNKDRNKNIKKRKKDLKKIDLIEKKLKKEAAQQRTAVFTAQ